jgi:hypothetical protein
MAAPTANGLYDSAYYEFVLFCERGVNNPRIGEALATERFVVDQLTSGDVAARKAYLSSVVDAILVSEDKIRIVGLNDNIRPTFGPQGQPTPLVRKSVQEWRAQRDSNFCPRNAFRPG